MEPKDYINHSGGAQGADLMWDTTGRKYGVVNHKHWRPNDLTLYPQLSNDITISVHHAARVLGRPDNFRGIELVRRNWFQVHNSEAIYAISRIVEPLEIDKGYVNRSGKQVVSGGTGWAVEMAIQKGVSVYVFDINTNEWYRWGYNTSTFIKCEVPILTQAFAGIGSRELTPEGIKAIEDVYIKTFGNGKEN